MLSMAAGLWLIQTEVRRDISEGVLARAQQLSMALYGGHVAKEAVGGGKPSSGDLQGCAPCFFACTTCKVSLLQTW